MDALRSVKEVAAHATASESTAKKHPSEFKHLRLEARAQALAHCTMPYLSHCTKTTRARNCLAKGSALCTHTIRLLPDASLSRACLIHVHEHELSALLIHLVHLPRHDSVARIVQGQEEAVHLHEALALDQMRRHGDGLGALRVQLESQLPRQALEAKNLALEKLPLEALDVKLQHVYRVMAKQPHGIGELLELHSAMLASEVAITSIEAGALLANAPIVEGERLASHHGAGWIDRAIESMGLATLP